MDSDKKLTDDDDDPKPCGEVHPLPCGLDKWCPVDSEYFDVVKTNEEICEEAGI